MADDTDIQQADAAAAAARRGLYNGGRRKVFSSSSCLFCADESCGFEEGGSLLCHQVKRSVEGVDHQYFSCGAFSLVAEVK